MPETEFLLRPSIFPPGIIAGSSTRRGGVSPEPLGMNLSFRVGDLPENVEENRRRFFGALGIGTDELAVPEQVHGDRVEYADHPGTYPACDALLTSASRLFLCITTADCVPILLADPGAHICVAVHAGWRGTALRIVSQAVERMVERGASPERLLAYIGPSAGPCCYEVGSEVASRFAPQFVRQDDGKLFLDLSSANMALLEDAGVPHSRIERNPLCTIRRSDLFHSYRRDAQKSGRMMTVVGFQN